METKTINLRDVPEELVRRAKMYAALRGMTLKDLVLHSLQQTLSNAESEFAGAMFTGPARKSKKGRR